MLPPRSTWRAAGTDLALHRRMRRLIPTALLALLLLSAPMVSAQSVDPSGEAVMLQRINELRAAQQLAPLARSAELDAVARAHSTEMAQAGTLTHISPTTGSPEDRVQRAGLAPASVAENVASNRDAAMAQEALAASTPHRNNMLSPSATHVGIGVVPGEQGVFATQVFAGMPDAPMVAPGAPVAVAVPAEEDDSVFQIIPPFVEQAVEQVASPLLAPATEVVEPVLEPVVGAAAPVLAPLDPSTVLLPGAEVDAPPALGAPDAPVAGAPAGRQIEVSPEAAATLRQLVGLGLSLLGGAPAAQ